MASSSLHLLGIGLGRGGSLNALLPDGALELIGFLTRCSGVRCDRGTIVRTLWPDQDELGGRSRLATMVWRVRSATKKARSPIISEGDQIALDPAIWVDAIAFQRHAQPFGRIQRACNRPALHKLRAAIRVYRGEFLQGHSAEWIETERARLHYLYLDTLYALAFAEAGIGNWNDVITVARHLCDAEPLREDAHRLLMEAYARTGNRALAIRQYALCACVLREELAVQPMPETAILYEHITGLRAGTGEVARSNEPVRQEEPGEITDLLIGARASIDRALELSGVECSRVSMKKAGVTRR